MLARSTLILWSLAVCLVLIVLPAGPSAAEPTPSQRYSRQLDDTRDLLKAFSGSVEAYNHAIAEITAFDLQEARAKVEEIRVWIGRVLEQIDENSALAQTQTELQRWIERNRLVVRTDPLLSAERKAYLDQEWASRAREVEQASAEIKQIRQDLRRQLEAVRGDENYLTQLVFLEKADEAVALVRQFLEDIRAFSVELRTRLQVLQPEPGS